MDEFFRRVNLRESNHFELPDTVYHVRCVFEVLREAVSPGEFEKLKAQLPIEFASLFEAGSQGNMTNQDAITSMTDGQ